MTIPNPGKTKKNPMSVNFLFFYPIPVITKYPKKTDQEV